MFLGKHYSRLDKNNRLPTPAVFREELATGLYLTQGFDRNLVVLTRSAFKAIYKTATALNVADPLARGLRRLILASAQEVHLDTKGNLAIPAELREFASLQGGVLVVGQGDYFEIWSPEQWENQAAQLQDADANASRFSGLTVATR